ncbi:hypothetical protein JHK82_034789 [Glycine max]|uniref:Uncharacterized protein n=1 Tax=Glycine max TaxID=3847 RepID=A0A0R0H9G7_SOYBN|nr:hypothetical protein JHK87_034729 [Glycine soja]KAG4981541.1 hypothetical protein JHK85_035499 [Glycine max]KAG4987161.1 hypothetical protein JHK86_034852 [Glycine max]KAG5120369.1 hypothetical protein JHK82_034789 [Glycine max]KAG5141346.1 hypothetical protein JHK84_035114 [Glycine max]
MRGVWSKIFKPIGINFSGLYRLFICRLHSSLTYRKDKNPFMFRREITCLLNLYSRPLY